MTSCRSGSRLHRRAQPWRVDETFTVRVKVGKILAKISAGISLCMYYKIQKTVTIYPTEFSH